jgi:hypothetical protein
VSKIFDALKQAELASRSRSRLAETQEESAQVVFVNHAPDSVSMDPLEPEAKANEGLSRHSLPKQDCSIRSNIEVELAATTSRVDQIMDQLRVLEGLGNLATAKDREEVLALSFHRDAFFTENKRILQKLGVHRAKHDC